ncbi:MAG: hypothetical protein JSW05_11830 [Candidatus Thorarchaeota archaeon]|nr:MAG: hypothetical protein JSW05_11830 [Candidatus Thorarchaeota archaeon]
MSRCDVAVATRNSRIHYLMVSLLKRLGVTFVLCIPDDDECKSAKVIVTTEEESKSVAKGSLVVVEDTFNPDTTAIEIMLRLLEIPEPTQVVVGVDPGMRFGLAFVANGTPVYTRTVQSPSGAAEKTHQWITHLQHNHRTEILIRVGMGSRLYSALFLRGIRSIPKDVNVELVDERHTTRVGKSDQSSAVLIAARKGRPVTEDDLVLDVKQGYVKSLKRLFTRLTDGGRTLSTADARAILLDETTVDGILNESDH